MERKGRNQSLIISFAIEYTSAAATTEMDILTISFPISTVVRNVLGAFKRFTMYLEPEPFRIFLRRNLTLLSEKKDTSDEEKKPEISSKIIIAKSFV